MTTIENWRNFIGIIEIIAGSFLVLPIILILFAVLIMSSHMTSQSIMEAPSMFGLTFQVSSYGSTQETIGGFFILNGFFWIGIVLLINGIWKIRSNKYLK